MLLFDELLILTINRLEIHWRNFEISAVLSGSAVGRYVLEMTRMSRRHSTIKLNCPKAMMDQDKHLLLQRLP